MNTRSVRGAIAAAIVFISGIGAPRAAPPTLDDFFSGAQIRNVAISPNGQYLVMIVNANDRRFVAVKDRFSNTPASPVVASNGTDSFEPRWCRFANDERVVCSFMGRERDKYIGKVFPVTRLVAVNRDGSRQKLLLQDPMNPSGQLNDNIIDWTPEDPATVLIQKYNPRVGVRVLKLDVYTGDVDIYENAHQYIGGFGTDGHGHVRLGWGVENLTAYYFAKLEGETKWRRLSRANVLSTDETFEPIAVIPGTNYAYATKDHEGRQALWQIDLTDKEDPKLVFASSLVDVQPVFTPDNRVLAVLPDSGSKGAYYVDSSSEVLGQILARLFPDKQYHVLDMSADLKNVVVLAESDVRAPEYFVLDMSKPQAQLQRVGSRFPGLDKTELASTQYVTYPARDGTQIPAYLTKPVSGGVTPPPLIILPHGGPWARERWGFDSWVQMLVRDGYAVLQMNYRGSAGYGKKWREASYRDWGGLPYSDTIDGLKWAVENKHGDPKRVCVVGGSFGGYLALAAAARDSALLKCVVSVAGVSDLRELKSDSNFFTNARIVKDMIGSDPEKLKADSPRVNAGGINVPVLLIHGADDWTVEADQSQMMAKAMTTAGKPYKMLIIPDTDHYFQAPGPQRQLFSAISDFLKQYLAPVPTTTAAN